jgi:hypothetical protein
MAKRRQPNLLLPGEKEPVSWGDWPPQRKAFWFIVLLVLILWGVMTLEVEVNVDVPEVEAQTNSELRQLKNREVKALEKMAGALESINGKLK